MSKCKQCGRCCKSYYLKFLPEDAKLWEKQRDVGVYPNPFNDGYVRYNDSLWADGFYQDTKNERAWAFDDPYYPQLGKSCPYLMYQPHFKKYICRLHAVGAKPLVCRGYLCDSVKKEEQRKKEKRREMRMRERNRQKRHRKKNKSTNKVV
jgi:hypothetical protein